MHQGARKPRKRAAGAARVSLLGKRAGIAPHLPILRLKKRAAKSWAKAARFIPLRGPRPYTPSPFPRKMENTSNFTDWESPTTREGDV
jgi:hypothetical protein